MTDREFDLGDVLTITTGVMLSARGMKGVRDILNHLAGEPVFPHQVSRLLDEARPVILKRYPDLADVGDPVVDETTGAIWLKVQKARYGETLAIAPLTEDEHQSIDPLSEMAEKINPSKIRVLIVDDDGKPIEGVGLLDPQAPSAKLKMAWVAYEQAMRKGSEHGGPIFDMDEIATIAFNLVQQGERYIGAGSGIRDLVMRATALGGAGRWPEAMLALETIRKHIPHE